MTETGLLQYKYNKRKEKKRKEKKEALFIKALSQCIQVPHSINLIPPFKQNIEV